MRILISIIISLFLFLYCAEAARVDIKGICGDTVLIGDQILEVGDSYKGTEVIAIKENSVTFKDKDGKAFTQEFKISFWDELVEKIRRYFSKAKKEAEKKSKAKAEKKSEKDKDSLAQGVAKYIKSNDAANLSITQRESLAEDYLSEFQREADTFFAKAPSGKVSQEKVMEVTDQYNKILQRYNSRFNSLHLPCPRSKKAESVPNLSGYISWSESYQEKTRGVMEEYGEKIERFWRTNEAIIEVR